MIEKLSFMSFNLVRSFPCHRTVHYNYMSCKDLTCNCVTAIFRLCKLCSRADGMSLVCSRAGREGITDCGIIRWGSLLRSIPWRSPGQLNGLTSHFKACSAVCQIRSKDRLITLVNGNCEELGKTLCVLAWDQCFHVLRQHLSHASHLGGCESY